jgi:hypothetical protein
MVDVCGCVVLVLSASRQEVASFFPPFSQFFRQIFSTRHILYFDALRPQPQLAGRSAPQPATATAINYSMNLYAVGDALPFYAIGRHLRQQNFFTSFISTCA